MKKNKMPAAEIFLLPRRFRITGYALTVIGMILSYIRFSLDLKLKALDIKVFAFYSAYFEKKYFSIIDNNFTEEAAILFLLTGLLFIAFSKEKIENEIVTSLRIKALFNAIYLNFIITVIAVIFVYGLAFIQFLVMNLFLMILLYIIISKYLFIRYKKEIYVFEESN